MNTQNFFKKSLLKNIKHNTIRAFADGVKFGEATFTISTFGQDFLRGASGSFKISGFPQAGTDVTLRWQESQQNFAIEKVEASGGNGSGGGGSGGSGAVTDTCTSANFTNAIYNAITVSLTLNQVNQTIGCKYSPNATQAVGNTVLLTWIESPNYGQAKYIVVYFDATESFVKQPADNDIFKFRNGF